MQSTPSGRPIGAAALLSGRKGAGPEVIGQQLQKKMLHALRRKCSDIVIVSKVIV